MSDILKYVRNLVTFSLIEVLIIIGIIGGLSIIMIPIYNNNLTTARICEADANLGSIRTELRIYSSEHGEYPIVNPAGLVIGAHWNSYDNGEIAGKYFTDSSYTYFCENGSNFIITCDAGVVLVSDRTLNQSGTLTGGI